MIYRERCVISKETTICSINNRLTTLKNSPVEDSYKKDDENFHRLTQQQKSFYTPSNTNTINQSFKIDYCSSLYRNINRLECFF